MGILSASPRRSVPSSANAEGYRLRAVSNNQFLVVGTRTTSAGMVTGNAMVAYLLDSDLGIDEFNFFPQKKTERSCL